MIKKLFKWFKPRAVSGKIIPRSEHNISRDNISRNALKVLYRLNSAGFKAYLVGGCIRDLLLGKHPKDFDIATNASPEQIKDLFSNCRLIGRRFRLAHVHFGREIIEVATFRSQHVAENVHQEHGMILRDNVYGTIEEDVMRRDFTINALYYNIADFSVVDFVAGLEDLAKRQLVLIGDPETRYREDPVRMLRAIRFAVKLQFTIHPKSAKPIFNLGNLLTHIPAARLFEEFCKLFLTGHAYATYKLLCEFNLFKHLFPQAAKHLTDEALLIKALHNTDERVAQGKSLTPSFLWAVFLWQPMLEKFRHKISDGEADFFALQDAMDQTLSNQQRVIAAPRRFTTMAREIWELQHRLETRKSARQVAALFASPKFKAAYDFLLLRAEAGEQGVIEVAKWWRIYVESDESKREILNNEIKSPKRKNRRKKSVGASNVARSS